MTFREIFIAVFSAFIFEILRRLILFLSKLYKDRDLFNKIFAFNSEVYVSRSRFQAKGRSVLRESDAEVERMISLIKKIDITHTNCDITLRNPTKHIIVIGSPRFNNLAKEIQKYFDLPYQFVFSSTGLDPASIDLSIITEHGDQLVSSIDRQFRKSNNEIDYGLLFIGNLPNKKRIIWIGGIHGAGTLGIAKYIRDNPNYFLKNITSQENSGMIWLFRIKYMPNDDDLPKILRTEILGDPRKVNTASSTHAKVLICDLGNVLMDFDRTRTYRSIGRLLHKNHEDIRNTIEKTDLLKRYEKGMIDTYQFKQELLEMLNTNTSIINEQLLEEFWGDIFWEKPEMHQALIEIKKQGIVLILLSNTNPLHFDHICKDYQDLISLFDDLVLSYEENCLKPDLQIFEAALKKIKNVHPGIKNRDILYVDDIPEFTMAAKELDLESYTFRSYPHFIFWLRKFGIYIA